MLAYSDNYKHNNLIYSQVVLMDVTTNGPTTLENLEAGKTCKKQHDILMGMCRAAHLSPSHNHLGLWGLVWKQANTPIKHGSECNKMPISPEFLTSLWKWQCHLEAEVLLLWYVRDTLYSHNHYWCTFNYYFFFFAVEIIQLHHRKFDKHKKGKLTKQKSDYSVITTSNVETFPSIENEMHTFMSTENEMPTYLSTYTNAVNTVAYMLNEKN